MKKLIAAVFLMGTSVTACAQTYTQMQWGVDKTVTPYAFGANINGTWRNLGTVSSGGAWLIPSSNISLTQPGTGAVATNVGSFLNQYYHLTGYGTIAQALTAAGSSAVNVPLGSYSLSAGVTLGNQQQLNGDLGGNSSWTYSATASPMFTLNGDASMVKNARITQTGSPTSSIGIQFGADNGQQKTVRDVRLLGPFTTAIKKAAGVVGVLDNVSVTTSGPNGIVLSNPTIPDSGDDTWHAVTVSGPTGDLVNYRSAGGLKVSGFKGLGGTNGFHMALDEGVSTQDFLFTGSSIENSSANCMLLERTGVAGQFGNINIVGSEFAGCPTGIKFNNAGVANAIVAGNTFSDMSSSAIEINAGANNINVGINSYSAATPIIDNRNNAFTDEEGVIVWRFKRGFVNVQTGGQLFYRIDVPAFRAAHCTAISEGVVQGAGAFLRHDTFSLLAGAGGAALTYAAIANMSYTAGQTVDLLSNTALTGGAIYIGLAQRAGVGSSVAGTIEVECRGKVKQIVYQ